LVAPDAVAGLNANVEEQRLINLVWPNAARAARYDLYWSTTPGLSVQTAQRIENVQSPFKHQGLLGGLEYFYIVQAVNAAGVSAPSSEVSATLPPGAVSGLSVTSGDSAIGLTWIEPPYAQQYRIYWANSLGSLQSNPAVINAGSPPFIHTGLQNGTPYYYALAPVGSAGEGPVSKPVSAQPQTPVPNSPRLLSAAMNPDDSSSAILLWQAPEVPVNPEDILYFQIYRSVEPNFANNLTPTNQLVRTSAGFFIDSVPVTGIPYYYRVTAVTAAGEGAPSSEVSVTLSGASEDSSSGISNPHGGVFDCGEPTHCWQY
jgi:fibronectin type 3 domain-containing protein